MLETKPITKGSPEVSKVEQLMHAVFPKSEIIPMAFLLARAEKEFIDFWAFYEQGEFVGFTYSITKDGLTFLQYLAVNSTVQSKGYGSKMLSHIQAQHPGNRLALNLEVLDEHAENSEQRKRRRAFYAKNNYEETGIITRVNGNTLDTLILGGNTTIEELQRVFKTFTGFILGLFIRYQLSYAEQK